MCIFEFWVLKQSTLKANLILKSIMPKYPGNCEVFNARKSETNAFVELIYYAEDTVGPYNLLRNSCGFPYILQKQKFLFKAPIFLHVHIYISLKN